MLMSGRVDVAASDGRYRRDTNLDYFSGNTIPTFETLIAVRGGQLNETTVDWYQNGGQTVLSLDMAHQRTGEQDSRTETIQIINFTATSNAPYELLGYYDVKDHEAPGYVVLYTLLFDKTIPITLFRNLQDSRETPDEQFVLGESGGDRSNILAGSLTGNLIKDHVYQFWAYARNRAYPDPDSGGSGVGNVTLKIGVVPEPSAIAQLGSLLLLMGAYRRGRHA